MGNPQGEVGEAGRVHTEAGAGERRQVEGDSQPIPEGGGEADLGRTLQP